MDSFLMITIVAVFLIFSWLAVFLSKQKFGLRHRKNQDREKNQFRIENGKIILSETCDVNQVEESKEIIKPGQSPSENSEVVTQEQKAEQCNQVSNKETAPVQDVKDVQRCTVVQEKPKTIKGKSRKKKDAATAAPVVTVIQDEELKELEREVVPGQVQVSKGRLPKIDRFWNYLEVAGRAKRTIQEYQYEWKWWQKEAALKGRTTYTLKVSEMEEILKGRDPSTTKRKIAFLRTLAKWYLREGYPRLHSETWKLTSPRLPKRIPKDKGTEQFEVLRDKSRELIADDNRVGLWIALKLICGLRISEIQTARIAGRERIQVLGKGSKERLVPVPRWIILAMKGIKEDGKGGWRKDRKTIWYHLAKMEIRNPHSLRHTCASELLRRDMKLEEIKEFLGHENISTTNIYARAVVPDRAAKLLDS